MVVEKFSKEYTIHSYECDKRENMRLLTLMNILQDMADSHAAQMNLGYDFCLKNGLAWVAADYHLKIHRWPRLHETVLLQTWPSIEKKAGAIRDYLVFDKNGIPLVQASTQWVLIDFVAKRPVALRKHLPEYNVVPERSDDYEFIRLPEVEDVALSRCFKVRFDDIDMNNHVNNSLYPLWAAESVPVDWLENKCIAEIAVSFKKPAVYGDEIQVKTALKDNVSEHNLYGADNELARVVIHWADLQADNS